VVVDTVKLEAEPRSVVGKKVKLLRRQGLVPANIYGHQRDSMALQLSERLVTHRITRSSRSTLFSLSLDGGEPQPVLVKQLQRHPTTGRVLHIDFYRVAMTEKLKASVPLRFVGEAPAVKQFDGSMLHNLSAVEVESLPADLPSEIEVDVSGLATLDDAVHVGDIQIGSGVEILTDAEELVAKVLPPVAPEEEVVEEEAAEEEAAEAEGEAPAEGEAEARESE
jgi:large subunit ribosomal protein L25